MTADDLQRRFHETFGFDLRDLAGASLTASIPVPESLANRLIADRLAASGSAITAVRVRALDDDAFDVELTIPALRIMTEVSIHAQIERQPLPSDPVLHLRWSMPAFGPLAMFAGKIASFVVRLPPGIQIDGRQIAIDLREVAASRGYRELLMHVTDLQLHTARGVMVVGIGVKIA